MKKRAKSNRRPKASSQNIMAIAQFMSIIALRMIRRRPNSTIRHFFGPHARN